MAGVEDVLRYICYKKERQLDKELGWITRCIRTMIFREMSSPKLRIRPRTPSLHTRKKTGVRCDLRCSMYAHRRTSQRTVETDKTRNGIGNRIGDGDGTDGGGREGEREKGRNFKRLALSESERHDWVIHRHRLRFQISTLDARALTTRQNDAAHMGWNRARNRIGFAEAVMDEIDG